MARPICEGIRKDGTRCRALSYPGSALCWIHDPERAEATAEEMRRGRAKGARVKALKGRRRRLDTPGGLAVFLNGIIHDVAEGKLNSDTARTVIYGCSVMRHLTERELERRVAELERKLDSTIAVRSA